jgi:hypothetical protein
MTPTICGHERGLLRSRLIAAQLRDEGIDVDGNATYRRELLIERGHDAAKLEASAAKCAAIDAAIHDPAKLGAILAEALRERGVSAYFLGDYYAAIPQLAPRDAIGVFSVASRCELIIQRGFPQTLMSIPKARATLLCILKLSHDATAISAAKELPDAS